MFLSHPTSLLFLPGSQFFPTGLRRRAPGPQPWAQWPQPPAEGTGGGGDIGLGNSGPWLAPDPLSLPLSPDPTGWPETQLCPPAALTRAQPRRQLCGPALPGPWRPLRRFLPETQEDFLRGQCQRCSRACTESLLGFLVFCLVGFFFFLVIEKSLKDC